MPENKISFKLVIIIGICIFAVWLPYLIVYYPGYIFGDTLYSILQAIGSSPLDNHHPVFYTLFIKVCLKIGNLLGGGNTLGCAIYCLIQMLYMSICISYVTSWLYSRFKLPKIFLIIYFIAIIFSRIMRSSDHYSCLSFKFSYSKRNKWSR